MKEVKHIKIPVSEVWELTNKPHRFFDTVKKEIEKIPDDADVEYLDWNKTEKEDIIKRLEMFQFHGRIMR